MKRTSLYICSLILLIFCQSSYAIDDKTRIALFYGDNPPLEELHAFNVVVVTPQKGISPKTFNNAVSELYAYVNVGEVDVSSGNYKQIDKKWRLGKNAAWNSDVVDLANPKWRDYLLNKIVAPLWENGYRGFFLDTLDSYQLLKLTPQQIKQQQAGIIDVINRIKARYPKASIIINRGFEVIDSIHDDVSAIAAESLFSGWDTTTKQYKAVSRQDRDWLLDQLNMAHQKYHLPVLAIDYVAPNDRLKTRQVARQISELGFIPWVTDAHLKTLGIGLIEVIPRKILILYNNSPTIAENRAISITAFYVGAFPLEFMGFIPVLQPVDSTLPDDILNDRYAGIITWFDQPLVHNHQLIEKWLSKQIRLGMHVLMMRNFGVPNTSPLLNLLNIKIGESPDVIKQVAIQHKANDIGYEVFPKPVPTDFLPVSVKNSEVLLQLTAADKTEDAIAITPWGGYVLGPYDIVNILDQQARWVINPFSFFRKALRLPELPVPDVTTASGRRILTIHIDGDGCISRVPWMANNYACDVILEQILKQYKLPTTVSIIQREFEIIKPSPLLFERITKVVQEIFALPWVQIATHTYSHPLVWASLVEGKPDTTFISYPDPSYLFSFKKEIAGSAEYINSHLAPPNKKVVAVFWSGDGNLDREKPLAIAASAGLKNINGMANIYINRDKSITNLSSFGIKIGKYFQVFSPIPNEFEYTDDWSPPLYTYENVIHTFELSEKPFRYKPMSIYYHFYIATAQASIRSLKRIYKWAVKQTVIPLQITDYIDKVNDFNATVIAKNINAADPRWLIANNKTLREFRWPIALGIPDLDKSINVIGFIAHNKDYYVHLGAGDNSWISFSQILPAQPYLIDANAEIDQWDIINDKSIQFSLQGYVPLDFSLANMQGCQLEHNGQILKTTDTNRYHIKDANNGAFKIHCTR